MNESTVLLQSYKNNVGHGLHSTNNNSNIVLAIVQIVAYMISLKVKIFYYFSVLLELCLLLK